MSCGNRGASVIVGKELADPVVVSHLKRALQRVFADFSPTSL